MELVIYERWGQGRRCHAIFSRSDLITLTPLAHRPAPVFGEAATPFTPSEVPFKQADANYLD